VVAGALGYRSSPELQARSSVVEHHLDMVVVGGSIPLAPTIRLIPLIIRIGMDWRGAWRDNAFVERL
jgi:hypothetical protein